jgi:hypothetical protein
MPKNSKPQARKARPVRKQASAPGIHIGTIKEVEGGVYVANEMNIGMSASQIQMLFAPVYDAIAASTHRSPAIRADLKDDVEKIQSTVMEAAKQNQPISESFLAQRFRSIARMAPDILDVVVATLGGPLTGMGVALSKIAQRAKEETGA